MNKKDLKAFAIGGIIAIKEKCEKEIASGKYTGKELAELKLVLKEAEKELEDAATD